MTKTDTMKIMLVSRQLSKVVDDVEKYLEKPPKKIAEHVKFLKMCHDFFLSAGVKTSGNKEAIKNIPSGVQNLWDSIKIKLDSDGDMSCDFGLFSHSEDESEEATNEESGPVDGDSDSALADDDDEEYADEDFD